LTGGELARRAYLFAVDEEEDARVCRDIPEEACTDVPRNFLTLTASLIFTKIGDAIINPKSTLPWLLGSLGGASWVVALLVPIRESGSLWPQLLIAGWLRRLPARKWAWVGGALVQGLAVLCMAGVLATVRGPSLGYWILGLLVLFSLARGFCSVANKDVLGKTVPKTRRGRVTGLASSAAGAGTLVFAAVLWTAGEAAVTPYIVLFVVGGLLWLAGAGLYASVNEVSGATEGGANAIDTALRSVALLRDDEPFRRFVLVRTCLMVSALLAPFLVALSPDFERTPLAYFLVAQGAGTMLSGPIWGKLADRSSRRLMMHMGIAAGTLGVVIALVALLLPNWLGAPAFLPGAFFALSIVHSGVRLGRKTYVVDLAGGNKRTDYVAVGNTLIGIALLAVGGITALLQAWSATSAIALLSAMGFIGAWLGRQLPEVQKG
jgi:MFS family permease